MSDSKSPVEPAALARYDQATAWMCYTAFAGDLEKTSIVAKIPLTVLRSLEHDFNWPAKLKRLKAGSGETEAERVANRAINYLQAQRMRDILQRTLDLLEDEEALIRALVKFKLAKDGNVESVEVSAKSVLETSKALESVHNMLYRALGDKLPAAADTTGEPTKHQADITNVRSVLNALTELATPPKPAEVTAIAVEVVSTQ